MTWPQDADGDVFRDLEADGFDFSKVYAIDFNVDFARWPPSQDAVTAIKQKYPDAVLHEPDGEFKGYVGFKVRSLLSYELVIRVQREVSDLLAPFGGRCDSWE